MPPVSPASLATAHTIKMLAIIEQWEVGSDCHIAYTEKYFLLALFKLLLDSVVFHVCCRQLFTSFLSTCSLSMVVADFMMTLFLATIWALGAERSPVSLCFLLANASVTYGALPLPVMFLGLLDYCLDDTSLCNKSTSCKFIRNIVLMLLGWTLAIIYSLSTTSAEVLELHYMAGINSLVCEVQESHLITYFGVVVFTAVLCTLFPFWSNIPRWVKEADRLCDAREERENQRSDLFISTNCTETKRSEEDYLEETVWPQPPLWLSLTLGFSLFWMPYLAITVACLLLDFAVPAYITVNVLWVECTNSLLMGVVFWAKSNTLGPYSHLPENVCLWHIYWHLSKGTRQQFPIAVFIPSKGKKTTLFYV